MDRIKMARENFDNNFIKSRDKQVKAMLQEFIFSENIFDDIFLFYHINNPEEKILLWQCLYVEINDRRKNFLEEYSECITALEYAKNLIRLIKQDEKDIYEERIDTIKDVAIPEELREHIVNTYRKGGYPFGLRIRRLPGEYIIYWDKIQLNNITFKDLGFNYSKELIEHGTETAKDRVRRLLM